MSASTAHGRGKDGAYVDLIAKIGRLQNEYTVYNDFGHYVKCNYSTWGGSLSAEYGKRIAMKGGTFIEPQVELIYSHLNGVSYTGSTDYKPPRGIERHQKLEVTPLSASSYFCTVSAFGDTFLQHSTGH